MFDLPTPDKDAGWWFARARDAFHAAHVYADLPLVRAAYIDKGCDLTRKGIKRMRDELAERRGARKALNARDNAGICAVMAPIPDTIEPIRETVSA